MMQIITPEMRTFLTPQANEEAVDQPIYHLQSYGTGGATQFTFFNTAAGSATNGLSDTNMDQAGALSAGKRFAVFAIGICLIPSAPMVFNAASTASALNDLKSVIEGVGNFQFNVLAKNYFQIAPLAYLPAGFGTNVGGASYQRTQASAADGNGFIAYGNNGMPFPGARLKLKVPIPIPQQVNFSAVLNFNSAITISTASRIGVFLDGLLIRAKQ